MADQYISFIVLEVDGKEIDVVSLSTTHETQRKPVKTMNRKGKTNGFVTTVKGYSLKVTAVVPKDSPINWDAIQGAKVSLENEDGSYRASYLECGTMSTSQQYETEGESRIDIEMYALDYVVET